MTGKFPQIPVVSAEENELLHGEGHGCAELEPFALRVIGDSMAPEFLDGHIIIVEPALSAHSGQYVVADYEGETHFRQYVVEDGRRYLRALNDGYPAIEIRDEGFRMRGVVVQRAGRRRRDRKSYY
jgi:SOS-response transcriptional repressor LexA